MTATDQLTNKMLEIINQLQQGVISHAHDALNLMLSVTRINGIESIAIGIITLMLNIIIIKFMLNTYKKVKEYNNSITNPSEKKDHDDYIPLYAGCALILFFSIPACVCLLLDIWNYIAIFEPKLYLAHQIIEKVIQ
jgi:hypothetical protein